MTISTQTDGHNALAFNISALQDINWKTRWQAAQTLGELCDSRAVPALLESLHDGNQWVRIVAAEALGQIGDHKAAHALMMTLDDESIWVRRACVVALGQIGDERAIPPLVNRLLDPPNSEWPEELRDAIAKALGAIGETALQTLIYALDDPDPWVNCAAARALGQIGNPSAIAHLSAITTSEHSVVRSAGTQALAQMADIRALRAALAAKEAPRAFWTLMALKELDESALDQLQALLDDPDEHIRAQAAEVLSRLGETASIEPLANALQSKAQTVVGEPPVRHETQETVATQVAVRSAVAETDTGLVPLLSALHDPDAEVRLAAAEALGKLGDSGAIPGLSEALGDTDSRVRAAAARSIGDIGAKSR
jgi:HEAT repeat protein